MRFIPRRALLAVVLALAALGVAPALASAACPATPSAKVFSPWGDNANYSRLPNGGFESGTTGWTVTKASVVPGNESFKVGGSADASSLAINPGGRAVSAPFCVSMLHPTFRFFGKRTSGSWGVLNAFVQFTDQWGILNKVIVGSLSGSTYLSWRPSNPLALGIALPVLLFPGSSMPARIVLEPQFGSGAWAVDDVYIDPYSR